MGLNGSIEGSNPSFSASGPAGVLHSEGWQSGRMRRSRKPLSVVRRIEGSNPSPSAQPSGSSSRSRFGGSAYGLLDRRAQSMEVRGRLQQSTGFTRHWRTTGAPGRGRAFSGRAPRGRSGATAPHRLHLGRRLLSLRAPPDGDTRLLAFTQVSADRALGARSTRLGERPPFPSRRTPTASSGSTSAAASSSRTAAARRSRRPPAI